MPPIQFLAERSDNGKTVAGVLRRRFQLTWSHAKRLVENGHVRVAGQLTRAPEQRVRTGNRMWIAIVSSNGSVLSEETRFVAKGPQGS